MNVKPLSKFEIVGGSIVVIVVFAMALLGCATTESVSPGTVTGLTSCAVSFILNSEVKPEDRVEIANQCWAIAAGVRSLSGGKAPDASQVKDAILSFGCDDTRWSALADAVGGAYENFYKDHATGDVKTALEVLEAIAQGVEVAARRISESK